MKQSRNYQGKILFDVGGYIVVRHRREIIIYCPCTHGIVARLRQREAAHKKSRLQDRCYHCDGEVPWALILPILRAQSEALGRVAL